MVDFISPEQFERLFPSAPASVRELNRVAWEKAHELARTAAAPPPTAPKAGRRLRQDTKPMLNKLETRALDYLRAIHPSLRWKTQALRFMLANGLWYKPDLIAFLYGDPEHWMVAYEVKGPHSFRGGFENLKMAASRYPDIAWFLIWEESPRSNRWLTQEILP